MTLPRQGEDFIEAMLERADRVERDPIRYVRWLPRQWAFLLDTSRVKQIRAGEQTLGKTTATCAEVIGRCRGIHPLAHLVPDAPVFRPPPRRWWIVCQSWKASVELMGKLHALLPREEVDWSATHWKQETGFGPKNGPVVVFLNGSIIHFRTAGQDEIDFASATLDGVLFDEPPPRELLEEAVKRVERKGGSVLLSYTPIHAPVDYLRELADREVEDGGISDHWDPLTPSELIPVGYSVPLLTEDGRPMDAEWIRHLVRTTSEDVVDVVVHGGWEIRVLDRYFTVWRDGGQDSHVHTRTPECDVDLVVGLDHGSKPGKQIVVLIATWMESRRLADGGEERVRCYHVLDEYTDATGTATPQVDARGILAMLARNGFGWNAEDLKFAGGDRVHMVGTGDQKSNKDLEYALAKEMGISPSELRPRIRTIKRGEGRGRGSVKVRARWLFHRMAERSFAVHPRCARVREALARTTLADDDLKDPFDAVVYGLDPYIFPRVVTVGRVSIR